MSSNVNIAEYCHVVQILAAVDINGGTSSDVFKLDKGAHASIIVGLGVTGGATTITVEECDNTTPTTHPAIAFDYYSETTDSGDTLSTRTTGTSSGITGSTNDNVFYVIELDAEDLSDGYPYVRLSFSNPSGATYASAHAIITGHRYKQEQTPTAIT